MLSNPSLVVTKLYSQYGSYRKLANASGLSHSQLIRISTGECKRPGYSTMSKLIKLLRP
jgi:transcriptional regulator with XRE-family HTH domain